MADTAIIPPSFLDDLLRNNGVPFLGAAGDGQKLATHLQAAGGQAEAAGAGAAGAAMARLPEVAQQFELAQDRRTLVSQVRDWLAANAAQPTAIHHLLAQFPFTFYFTTAYHDLLEQALTAAGRRFVRVVRQEDTAYIDGSAITVIKLLGDANQPDSLVLTEKDYLTFLDRSPLLADVVRSTLACRALLFLDYDLADAELRRLFFQVVRGQSVQRRSAYAVWPQPDENQRRFWAAENLQFIAAEPVAFLQDLHREIARRAPSSQPTLTPPVPPLSRRPFRFLDAYDAADADLFAGRQQEITLLSQKTLAHRLVVLTGASGTGKTSLVQAGVGPRLAAEGWRTLVIRPLGDPLAAMQRGLAPLAGDLPPDAALIERLRRAEAASKERLVLVLDQFEEFFTRLGADAQASFVSQLAPCLSQDDIDTRFVLSLRDDYFLRLGSLENQLPGVFRNVFILQRLTRDQAIAAVVEPLRRLGIEIEEGLARRIAGDLDKEGVDPPQLQIVCDRLYDDMLAQGRQRIDNSDYERLGGIAELLPAYLSDVLARLPQGRPVLETLVGDGGLRATRSLADIQERVREAAPDLPSILEKLIEARLVRGVSANEALHYELVHDVLAAEIWKWLSEGAREAERARGLLERGLSDWQTSQALFDAQRLDFVAARWPFLDAVAPETQSLLLRSAVRLGHDIPRWLERVKAADLQAQVLFDLSADPDAATRARVVERLANLPAQGEDKALAILQNAALADPEVEVRRTATLALRAQQGDAAVAFLSTEAQTGEAPARPRAVQDLAFLSDARLLGKARIPGSLRWRVAAGVARLRLVRHWPRWGWRMVGGLGGGALGFALGFSLLYLLSGQPRLVSYVATYTLPFGAITGLLLAAGIALAAALADGDQLVPRLSGGLIGGMAGFALGLHLWQQAFGTTVNQRFWPAGLLVGALIGAALGGAGLGARRSILQVLAGVIVGAVGFGAAAALQLLGWPLLWAILMGCICGGMIGSGLYWADRRSQQS